MANTNNCPYCGTSISPTARYCDRCGTPLKQADHSAPPRQKGRPHGIAPWSFALVLLLVFAVSLGAGYRYQSGQWPWVTGLRATAAGTDPNAPLTTDGGADQTDPALNHYMRSVVSISVRGEQGSKTGSGFIIDDQGHVVTSAHVIEGYRNCVNLIDDNGTPHLGTVVNWDGNRDVAVIAVPTLAKWPDTLEFRQEPLAKGDQVYVLGSPKGLPTAVLRPAQVDQTGVTKRIDERYYPNLVAVRGAYVEHGSSGSPLLDRATGKVAGIVTAAADTPEAYAIPVDAEMVALLKQWAGQSVGLQCRSPFAGKSVHLVLASITPLSGNHGIWGNDLAGGVALALRDMEEDLRKVGYEVSLAKLDDQGQEQTARERAETVAYDREVIGVVGSFTSQASAAIAESLAQSGLVQIAPTASAEELTAMGWPHFNRLVASTARMDAAAATFARSRLGVRSILVVLDGSPGAADRASSFETSAQIISLPLAGRLVLPESIDPEALRKQVLASKADAIYYAGSGQTGFQLAQALRHQGLTLPIIGGAELYDSSFETAVGPAWHDIYFTHFTRGVDERFDRHFTLVLGKPTRGYGMFGYDAARVILEALVGYGEEHPGQAPSRAELAARVRSTREHPGWSSTITLDSANGENKGAGVYLFEWVNGNLEPRE